MITVEQIKKLEYADLLYLKFVTNATFYKKKPVKAYFVFSDNFNSTAKLVVFFAAASGNISTRCLCASQVDMLQIVERFEKDFDIEVECHEHETDL